MKLAQAILLIPPGTHLKCGCEENPETGSVFGSACLYEEPPEDGWPDPPHPASKFLDRAITSITTNETDYKSFECLVVHMIVDRYGTVLQRHEAKAQLDRHTRQRMRQADNSAVKASW